LFVCPVVGVSPFWKGVIWEARKIKLGYQWKVGNGRKIKFWEDHWFDNCSLARTILGYVYNLPISRMFLICGMVPNLELLLGGVLISTS
jgi:hypothetical protein